jgi:hypothetical protein
MSQKFQFVSVDTIVAKYLRDFRGLDFNEDEVIEWIGEAVGFTKMADASEEAIAFLEVKNYQVELPQYLHYIIQIAKKDNWIKEEDFCCCVTEVLGEMEVDTPVPPITEDCQGNLSGEVEPVYYRPYFDLQYEYSGWVNYRKSGNSFTPVRLSNHTFFNTLVCQTEDMQGAYCNDCGEDEYTIVDDQLRFSFKEGLVAIAYLRQKVDPSTGYPMIPDDESIKAAITYYITWKVKQREGFNHREGAMQLSNMAEERWLKYIKQFKNKVKMPWGTDDYEDLMQQGNYLIPRRKRYYGYFGKLGKAEQKPFTDPTNRNNFRNRIN